MENETVTTNLWRVGGDLDEKQWMRWRRHLKRTGKKSVQTVASAVVEYLNRYERE